MKKFFGLIVGIFFLLSTFGMASATILNFDDLSRGDAIPQKTKRGLLI